MEVNFENNLLFTGGKDGTIFRTNLERDAPSQEITAYEKIYESGSKSIITCLSYDQVNQKLWYGTP